MPIPTFSKTTWLDVTPPGLGLNAHGPFPPYGIIWVTGDSTPNNIWCCCDSISLFKSTDQGGTWTSIGGTPPFAPNSGTTTTYFDSPWSINVNPANSNHWIVTQGVRGSTLGFWVTTDGGASFAQPAGFLAAVTTVGNQRDVTQLAIDPTDFNHLLLSSHSPWAGLGLTNAGILESFDGGNSWTIHMPVSTWPAGTIGIFFLYDPASGQGNSQRWFAHLNGDGGYLTTDSGATWNKVTTVDMPHGGEQLYYAPSGRIFCGGTDGPITSNDNGATWTLLTGGGLPDFYYYSVVGAGTQIYTQLSFPGYNFFGGGDQPWYTTPIGGTGSAFTVFQGGVQTFADGPFYQWVNRLTGVIYAACWATGLQALQAFDPSALVVFPKKLTVSIL